MVVPPYARQGFMNDGAGPFRVLWLLVPAGLKDFFVGIGRPVEQEPTPFPCLADAGAVVLATVSAALDPPHAPPWDTAPIIDPSVLEALRREAV